MTFVRRRVLVVALGVGACHDSGEQGMSAPTSSQDGPHPGESSSTTGTPGACVLVHEGDLVVDDATDLESLATIREVTGNVVVSRREPPLADLGALGCLERIEGGIEVTGTAGLPDLRGLEPLTYVGGSLLVEANDDLRSLEGLESLDYLSSVRIRSNPVLERIGLSHLLALGGLHIGWCDGGMPSAGNPSLQAIDGLDALLSLETVDVNDNAALVSVAGLRAMAERGAYLGSLTFRMNENLSAQELEELATLAASSLESCGNLGGEEVCSCPIK